MHNIQFKLNNDRNKAKTRFQIRYTDKHGANEKIHFRTQLEAPGATRRVHSPRGLRTTSQTRKLTKYKFIRLIMPGVFLDSFFAVFLPTENRNGRMEKRVAKLARPR